jgi:regulator of protease activity HflC (stomatin/prohibitin superfamily)
MSLSKRPPTGIGLGGFPVFGSIALVVALFLVLGVGGSSCVQVDKGFVGVKTTWGRVEPDSLKPGLHFIMPVAQRVTHVNVQVTPHQFNEIEAASQEMQQVFLTGMMNYHLQEAAAPNMVQNVGTDFAGKVIDPAFSDYIKEVVPKYKVTEIYPNRDKIRAEAKDKLSANLERYGVVVDDIYISNVSFSKGYQSAIESKQTAQQQVETERQVLEQKRMQAEQIMVDAKAEADAGLYKAQKQAEANGLLSRSVTQELIQYETMRKWDGKMPMVSGAGASPLLQLPAGSLGSSPPK